MDANGTRRVRAAFKLRLLFALAMFLMTVPAGALQAADVMRIEEDWQLVVANPDPANYAPQVTTSFSPQGNLDDHYAVFDLNLRNLPDYDAGGMQVQIWRGTVSGNSRRSNGGTLLQNPNEVVTWTQRMVLSGGQLAVAIVNGNSQSWGTFGTGSSMELQVPTNLTNLNGYNPEISLTNSGIGYSTHRVDSLVLVRVRAYSSPNAVVPDFQDTTPRVVFVRP